MPPKRGKSGKSDHSTNKKQKTNIDYTKLAAEIIWLQSGNINIPTSNNSTIIQADVHADAGTDHTRIIPTSPLSQNIDPAVNTVPTPIPSLAASEVRSRTSQIQENPPCTVASEDSADHNPSCSTSKEFNIQTVVETLFQVSRQSTIICQVKIHLEFKFLMASHWEPLFLSKN
ncbi:unnamed protein product [Mytilus coruscus]|uniref:Uncharacterized protein n=1 Tax=Mytilus coruscus TaxID=42192 RepID=A0A6J8B491_MYTCO|nr:unnamed protein product [Mytilus coruscus]